MYNTVFDLNSKYNLPVVKHLLKKFTSNTSARYQGKLLTFSKHTSVSVHVVHVHRNWLPIKYGWLAVCGLHGTYWGCCHEEYPHLKDHPLQRKRHRDVRCFFIWYLALTFTMTSQERNLAKFYLRSLDTFTTRIEDVLCYITCISLSVTSVGFTESLTGISAIPSQHLDHVNLVYKLDVVSKPSFLKVIWLYQLSWKC